MEAKSTNGIVSSAEIWYSDEVITRPQRRAKIGEIFEGARIDHNAFIVKLGAGIHFEVTKPQPVKVNNVIKCYASAYRSYYRSMRATNEGLIFFKTPDQPDNPDISLDEALRISALDERLDTDPKFMREYWEVLEGIHTDLLTSDQ